MPSQSQSRHPHQVHPPDPGDDPNRVLRQSMGSPKISGMLKELESFSDDSTFESAEPFGPVDSTVASTTDTAAASVDEAAGSTGTGSLGGTSTGMGSDAAFAVVRGNALIRMVDQHFRQPGDTHSRRMFNVSTFLCQVTLVNMSASVALFFGVASGTWVAAIMPLLYTALASGLIVYNWRTKGLHASAIAHTQLSTIAALPAAMHVQLGGFEHSGHQIHFVFMAPAFASIIFRGNQRVVGMYMLFAIFIVLLSTTLTEFGFIPSSSAVFSAARPITHVASLVSYQFSLIAPPLGLSLVLLFYSKTMDLLNDAREIALDNVKVALRDAKHERQANLAKTRFVSVMSHEIRNPLTGIILNSEMLLGTKLDPHQLDYCSGIERASQILLAIVNNVLDVTKIESGAVTLEEMPYNLLEATEFVCQTVAPSAFVKHLEVVLVAPPDVSYSVVGDPTRYRQVLHNLLGNAVKFTATGQVTVTLELVHGNKKRRASGATTANQGTKASAGARGGANSADDSDSAQVGERQKWRVSVRDSGIGIPPEGRKRLFKEFSQVDTSTTREYGGTGLGLFISKQLVELMGGRMHVRSAPGMGSEFSFTMRLHSDPDVHPEPMVAMQQSDVVWVVIILSANPVVGASMEKYLRYFFGAVGAEILIVSTARAAMKMLETEEAKQAVGAKVKRECIVVVDRDACSRVLEERLLSPGTSKSPLVPKPVLLTASLSAGERERVSADGWQHFVYKPVFPDQVCTIFAKLCTGAHAADDARATAASGGKSTETASTGTLVRGKTQLAFGTDDSTAAADAPLVLLVDDMDLVRNLVRRVVDQMGYRTIVASNGLEAYETLCQSWVLESKRAASDEAFATEPSHQISLILMDIEMPVMDGKEASRKIREWEAANEIQAVPICAMTGNAMREDVQECLQAGMNEFMPKPVNKQKLIDVLRKLAPKQAGGAVGKQEPASGTDLTKSSGRARLLGESMRGEGRKSSKSRRAKSPRKKKPDEQE